MKEKGSRDRAGGKGSKKRWEKLNRTCRRFKRVQKEIGKERDHKKGGLKTA